MGRILRNDRRPLQQTWVVVMLGMALLLCQDIQAAEKIPVIFDTDIGTDVDDAFALALCLSCPELNVLGVTTVNEDAQTRAVIACRFLEAVGRPEIPVAAGTTRSDKKYGQFAFVREPGEKKPVDETAVELIYRQLKARPGEITLLTVGDLSNVADLFQQHPDCKPWIKRIVMMAGAVRVGYNNKAPVQAEWNIRQNIKAAQVVFAGGVPLVVAPLDATTMLKLEDPLLEQVLDTPTPLLKTVKKMHGLWENKIPVLYDPVAVMLTFDERLCKMESLRLTVDDQGFTREVAGEPNARVATSIDQAAFLKWYADRVTGKR